MASQLENIPRWKRVEDPERTSRRKQREDPEFGEMPAPTRPKKPNIVEPQRAELWSPAHPSLQQQPSEDQRSTYGQSLDPQALSQEETAIRQLARRLSGTQQTVSQPLVSQPAFQHLDRGISYPSQLVNQPETDTNQPLIELEESTAYGQPSQQSRTYQPASVGDEIPSQRTSTQHAQKPQTYQPASASDEVSSQQTSIPPAQQSRAYQPRLASFEASSQQTSIPPAQQSRTYQPASASDEVSSQQTSIPPAQQSRTYQPASVSDEVSSQQTSIPPAQKSRTYQPASASDEVSSQQTSIPPTQQSRTHELRSVSFEDVSRRTSTQPQTSVSHEVPSQQTSTRPAKFSASTRPAQTYRQRSVSDGVSSQQTSTQPAQQTRTDESLSFQDRIAQRWAVNALQLSNVWEPFPDILEPTLKHLCSASGPVKQYLDLRSKPFYEISEASEEILNQTIKNLEHFANIIGDLRKHAGITDPLEELLNQEGVDGFLPVYNRAKHLRSLDSQSARRDYGQLRTLATTLCSMTNLPISLVDVLTYADHTLSEDARNLLMSGGLGSINVPQQQLGNE